MYLSIFIKVVILTWGWRYSSPRISDVTLKDMVKPAPNQNNTVQSVAVCLYNASDVPVKTTLVHRRRYIRWPFRTLYSWILVNVVNSRLKWHGNDSECILYVSQDSLRINSECTWAIWNCIEWKYIPSVWINKSQENNIKDQRHVSVISYLFHLSL